MEQILHRDNHPVTEATNMQVAYQLAYVYQQLQESGDIVHSHKIKQLIDKIVQRKYVIGLCGHFSAGKSSLINELFADGVLPTSPIPTSANIVMVKSGDTQAQVLYKDGSRVEFIPPFDIEEIKRFCLDGESIELVELQFPHISLPPMVSIMDTPGIDSTDDAHRLATESMLHMADVLFYVMDYNHVQSEINFNFCKTIVDRKIKLYLVINQIDKHRDHELSFERFKQGVKESFEQWNVHPEGIYYTSINDDASQHNELDALNNKIKSLIQEKEAHLNQHVLMAAKYIIHEHMEWFKSAHAFDVEDETVNDSLSELENIEVAYGEAVHHVHLLEQAPLHLEEHFQGELAKILYNSSLTPYDTRQLAQSYLESMQPKFKVGVIFTEKKTEEERQRRFQAFYDDIKSKAASQLEWYIKSLLQQEIQQFSINDDELIQSIYDLEIILNPSMLQRAVKKEANLSGDALLNYIKEVSESIKQIYKRIALDKLEELKAKFIVQKESELEALQINLQLLQKQLALFEAYRNFYNVLQSRKDQLLQVLNGEVDESKLLEAYKQIDINETGSIKSQKIMSIGDEKPPIQEKQLEADILTQVGPSEQTPSPNFANELKHVSMKLRDAANIVSDVVGFREDCIEMVQKAERMEQNRFTVALFGAFSAGKSSFANALMGNPLLPTSPNPTTAAITKILPPTSQYEHGTIRVKVKGKEELFVDLVQSLDIFGLHPRDFDEALSQISDVKAEELSSKAKPHYSFIKAIEKGIETFANQFGQVIADTVAQLEPYVAREEMAAFIEWIEIYYRLPLTEQGITLVDTPGADSIHSRHTGVAFEYIKNADALIYVTYYNHAFSQADQQFLAQLGRVKEAFELDKMFFIVNAIDLAKSEEEITLVTNYVESNLFSFGIRLPRIYPVSSKLGLEAKQNPSSGFPRFEREFISFTISELVKVTTNAAMLDIDRAIHKLQGYITLALENEESRQQRFVQVQDLRQKTSAVINQFDLYSYNRAIEQEVEELLYYVKQRIYLRQKDTFKICFSPAVLRKDVKDIKKTLKQALVEWLENLQLDLLQEIRASSLRIENFLKKQLDLLNVKAVESVHKLDSNAIVSHLSLSHFQTPDISNDSNWEQIEKLTSCLSMFKNHKQFFEQGGNATMLEELEKQLQTPISNYLDMYSEAFTKHYLEELTMSFQDQCRHFQVQISSYYEGEMAALSMNVNVEELHQKYQKLLQLC